MNSTETEEFSCNENSGTVINKNSKYEESVWEINYKIGTEKKKIGEGNIWDDEIKFYTRNTLVIFWK